MSMFSWLKNIFGADLPPEAIPNQAQSAVSSSAATAPANDEEVSGLNFKTAIEAHRKWKVRLADYIDGRSSENLSVDTLCRDDQCLLGKWIYSSGGDLYGGVTLFTQMKSEHAQFHRCAGEILGQAQSGNKVSAKELLETGPYRLASDKVQLLLAQLYLQARGKI